MAYTQVLVFSLLFSVSWCMDSLAFPSWFKFGASTAAYQVEGAWNISGRGESMWDRLLHTRPEVVVDGTNGDVACDSYHLWRRDIEMATELGLDLYRMSISWTRLLPNGFSNYINEEGKKYYSNLIDGLLAKGIEPVVTIYHFDLPQIFQDLGGWTNPLIVDWYADYVRVVYSLYADRIKYWLTINEPFGFCDWGYNKMAAPYLDDNDVGRFLCNRHTMLAHAKAWRIYDEEYKPKFKGKVSIPNIFFWLEPETPDDEEVTNLALESWGGRYSHPIYSKEGGWPPALEKFLNEKGKEEGYPTPRLPPFTAEEIEFVKGTYDFYALNHYSTRLVRKARPGEKIGAWPLYGSQELGLVMVTDPAWETTDIDWFPIYPKGLRKQLHWLNQTYGVSEVMITENGYPSQTTGLDDTKRLEFIRDNLEQILLAISDGLNVTGYCTWTLMDNFEWLGGYSTKFGLYEVDFSDPNRTRTPRKSAKYYASLTRSRTLHRTQDVLNDN